MVKYGDGEAFVPVTGSELVGQFIEKACNKFKPAPKPGNIRLHVSEDSGPLNNLLTLSELAQEHNITKKSRLIMKLVPSNGKHLFHLEEVC